MPHDVYGNVLAPGDIVYLPCKVKAIHQSEEYCNMDLEYMFPLPPTGDRQTTSYVNTRQVYRADSFVKKEN